MRLKKIHILDGQSQYAIFSDWARALQDGFISRGVDAEILAPGDECEREVGEDTVSLGFNMVRCWNSKTLPRRHLMWSVDHPVFNLQFFIHYASGKAFAPNTVPLMVDRSRCHFAEQVFLHPRTEFLPHAATAPWVGVDDGERPLEAIFFGSIETLSACRARVVNTVNQVAQGMMPFFDQILDRYHFDSDAPMDLQIYSVMKQGLKVSAEVLTQLYSVVYPWIDYYFRMQHRIMFMQSIQQVKLHIYGNGPWQEIGLSENITLHPAVEHWEMPALLQQSHILLNHAPTLRDGGHERVFDGLMSGCGIVSTPSIYLQEEFGVSKGVMCCPAGAEAELDAMIQAGVEGIGLGQARVQEAHTMDVRAAQLLNFIEQQWGLVNEGAMVCAE